MNLAAIVLAAGQAKRFGSDKLSTILDGEPLLFHAVRAARAAPVDKVIVVTRPGVDTGAWDGSPPVEVVRLNSEALSDSLRAGLAAARKAQGAFIFLGDMPAVPHQTATRLARLLGSAYAALPRHNRLPGHPVLLSARAFDDIAFLTGDEGAGRLLRGRDDVVMDECDDPAVCMDVDRPEDLDRLRARRGAS